MCNRSPEHVDLHVVREAAPSVDLDHGQPLPVAGLEGGIAGDVDLTELEAELRVQGAHLLERPVAEVAAPGVVDDDLGQESPYG